MLSALLSTVDFRSPGGQLPETFSRQKSAPEMANCPDMLLAIVFRQNSPEPTSSYVAEGQM